MAVGSTGTVIEYYSGSAWTALAEISDVTGPDFSKDDIETTALDAADGFKTYISGLKDAGSLTMEMNFTKATFKTFYDIFLLDGSAGIKWWNVTLNDASADDDKSVFWFEASVTQIPLRIPTNDRVTATATLKISGAPKYGLAGGAARSVDGVAFGAGDILPADPTV